MSNKVYEVYICRYNGEIVWLGQCNPPYQGTTEYKDREFDHEQFYEWCREQAKHNVVFVSEYDAPDDFECVWSQEVKSSLSANGVSGGSKKSVEKLFKVNTQE